MKSERKTIGEREFQDETAADANKRGNTNERKELEIRFAILYRMRNRRNRMISIKRMIFCETADESKEPNKRNCASSNDGIDLKGRIMKVKRPYETKSGMEYRRASAAGRTFDRILVRWSKNWREQSERNEERGAAEGNVRKVEK
jgi:hypothetical protein